MQKINKLLPFLIFTLAFFVVFKTPSAHAEELMASSTPAVVDTVAPSFEASVEAVSTSSRNLIVEPTIRVGLYKTTSTVTFVSNFPYEIYSGVTDQGVLLPGETAEVTYQNGLYNFTSASHAFVAPQYIRLVPSDPQNYFTLPSYSRVVKGRGKNSYNSYRGTFEYRYSPKSGMPYIINELPLNEYTAGIAEMSDGVPVEYAKALLVAARSYAYAHISSAPATEKRMFDVYATTVDQIYLGYNSELFMPHIAAAATATAGEMVTYKSDPVLTFYFGNSNGKTKTWTDKPTRPWLKSVEAAYDKGKKMYGHGYGMSCHDAESRARKDGWDYQQILTYYYSGVAIEKVF